MTLYQNNCKKIRLKILLKQSKKASYLLLLRFPPQFFISSATILLFFLLLLLIYSIHFPIHDHIDPTSTLHRPYIDPTWTLHRSHIDPTLNFFFQHCFVNSETIYHYRHISIVWPFRNVAVVVYSFTIYEAVLTKKS